jgi:hypothetical protein
MANSISSKVRRFIGWSSWFAVSDQLSDLRIIGGIGLAGQ